MDATRLQAIYTKALGKAAAVVGQSYQVCRPGSATNLSSLSSFAIGSVLAQFTSGKSQGFNFDRPPGYDDVLWMVIADPTRISVGDFLLGPYTYFVASMDPLLPISCVRCNQIISLLRPNSQVPPTGGSAGGMPSQQGGTGTYWGANRMTVTSSTAVGERQIASNVPCAVLGTAGRATGTGEDPSGPAGPTRWKFHLPQSVFPKGSVEDGDIIVDQESYRHMVSASAWTSIGYRAEAVRQEVQG